MSKKEPKFIEPKQDWTLAIVGSFLGALGLKVAEKINNWMDKDSENEEEIDEEEETE